MKPSEEFVKAMETAEMQEAFEKFAEGKTVATAEDADKLVKEFAAENGFDISDSTVEFVASDESMSEEELAKIAGGRDIRGENAVYGASGFRDANAVYGASGFRDVNAIYVGGIRGEKLRVNRRDPDPEDDLIRLGLIIR